MNPLTFFPSPFHERSRKVSFDRKAKLKKVSENGSNPSTYVSHGDEHPLYVNMQRLRLEDSTSNPVGSTELIQRLLNDNDQESIHPIEQFCSSCLLYFLPSTPWSSDSPPINVHVRQTSVVLCLAAIAVGSRIANVDVSLLFFVSFCVFLCPMLITLNVISSS